MRSVKLLLLFTLAIILGFISSCKKESSNTNGEVKEFIWKGLNEAYLWVDQVPNLSSSTYSTQASLDKFLGNYSDPEALFYDLLYNYGKIDKWSWVTSDYTEIENWIQGVSKSMGFEFGLSYISKNSNNIIGYVYYVEKGGPAYRAGIKRGDVFF